MSQTNQNQTTVSQTNLNHINPKPSYDQIEDFIMEHQSKPNQTPNQTYHPIYKQNQVGGKHYQLTIQPVEYISKNKLSFNQGNVIKYITRHKEKNGVEDIKKVIHYTLIEAFYSYPPDQFEDIVNWLRNEINNKDQAL